MPGEKCAIKSVWTADVPERFNSLSVGKVFRYPGLSLIIGCEDGVVRIYQIPTHNTSANTKLKCISSLETKGGPIQTLCIHDVTRFYSNDVTVADSRGTVTVFCNEQILSRKVVSEHCIHCMKVEQDALGNIAIVTSDGEGHISAFNPYRDLWRVRLTDIRQLRGLGSTPYVSSLITIDMVNAQGHKTNYIIAADNCRHLYFLHQGAIVKFLTTPAPISAMCSGKFVSLDDIEGADASDASNICQVALGSENGAIYIMNNFELYTDEFANIQLPLTQLCTLPAADSQQDSLLCAGNFNSLIVLRDAKEVARYKTPAWISSMETTDLDGDGQLEVIAGCLDSSVHALKISNS